MPRGSKEKKDRTSAVISLIFHLILVGGVAYWAWKSGQWEIIKERILQLARSEKKEKTPEQKPIEQRAPPKLPPINQGMPPPTSGGTRRAVASDAPSAAGESFFQDMRRQVQGPSTSGGGARQTNAPIARTLPPPPLRPTFRPMGPSTISQLLVERAKAVAATEAIGAEQISRSGASDAGGAVTKVAGASIVDGKYAVIRGLSDRYVSTMLNGANLPSADPYRQSAPLDLFPAQIIDRVLVTKTFTPDQPGTATGGGIDVITKSFPERQFFTMSLGGEYNTQASLNDKFLTYSGGSLDWAGMDDGTRALPSQVSQLAPIGQKLPDAPLSSGPIGQPVFFQSVSNASLLDKVSRSLGVTEFGPKHETPPLNHNFFMAGGGSTLLFGRPLGYFASTSYKHDYAFYDDGVYSRYQNGTELKSQYHDTRALSVVNWSGMVNLAYKPFEDHELGFTFFYNQNGTDDTRLQDQGFERTDVSSTFRKFNLYYTERNLNTYQMRGEHHFPDLAALQFNWLVALTQTTQDEPDARFFNDVNTGSGYTTAGGGIPAPNKPTRYFRNLDEDNQNVKLDWTLPFRNWAADEGKLKFGLFASTSSRTFTERQFYYTTHGGYMDDPNLYLTEDQLGLVSVRTNFVSGRPRSLSFNWGDYVQVFDSRYNGDRDIGAGYLMLELPVGPKLRFVGGARYETTDYSVHSESYLDSSITSKKTNDTHLTQSDLLPAAGLIFAVRSNMNVRLNFSKTIARPSFRELAAYYSYDPIISDFVEGNPLLQMSSIDNYDVRWEWFPRPGELLSVSLFYKDIKDAIERGNVKQEGDIITFFNNDATLYGIEFEARKSLGFLGDPFRPFSLGGNFSLIESEVKLSDEDLESKRQFFPNASSTRPLYDQSPYIVNLDLNYYNPYTGTSASLIFNVAGPRITITKLNTKDVYEQPAPVLDFVLSQKIGRRMTVKFAAKNLLDPKFERTYGKNSDLLYSSYTRGRAFGLTFSYDF